MNRRYDIDAIRVIAFAILILYHCAMLYVPNWGWHIKSSYQIDNLDYVMRFFNAWRMPLIFLISGTAIALAKPHQWLSKFIGNRTYRLLFPLIVAMLTSIPLQAFVQASSNGTWVGPLHEFLVHYFTFQEWPAGAFDGSHVGFTWNHLWYLPYLFLYTMLLTSLIKLAQMLNLTGTITRFVASPIRLLASVTLYFGAVKLTLQESFPETHALWGDWYAHLWYCGYFLLGYLLGLNSTKAIWESIKNTRFIVLLFALNCYVVSQLMLVIFNKFDESQNTIYTILSILFSISAISAILGYGFRYLNRPDNGLGKYSLAIFPWYIFHQTYIILIAFFITPLNLGVTVEFLSVVILTAASCLGTYKLIVYKLPYIKPAIGIFK